jgi:sigma-B regulation protein RsbU (phosphoserine phosphatase)
VGGDYYDVLPFGPDHVLFVIADVSGKGAPAALVMSTLRAYLHSAVRFKMSLEDIVAQLNTSIFRDTEAQRFVTLVLGKLDKKKHVIEYVNAGHNYPALLSEKNSVLFLESNDIPLGILEDYHFSLHTLPLRSKETLVLYTDGITESMDSSENLYGEEWFVKDLRKGPGESLEKFSQTLFDRAFHFAQGKQTDDMTLLLFRRE